MTELFIVKPCLDSIGYIIKPRSLTELNLLKIHKTLSLKKNVKIQIYSEMIMVLSLRYAKKSIDITINRSGKLQLRNIDDVGIVKKLAKEIFAIGT